MQTRSQQKTSLTLSGRSRSTFRQEFVEWGVGTIEESVVRYGSGAQFQGVPVHSTTDGHIQVYPLLCHTAQDRQRRHRTVMCGTLKRRWAEWTTVDSTPHDAVENIIRQTTVSRQPYVRDTDIFPWTYFPRIHIPRTFRPPRQFPLLLYGVAHFPLPPPPPPPSSNLQCAAIYR